MDFLENVKSVVSDGARAVAKKSGELVEASKIQYAIFDLNNDIKKLYSEIGKLTYEATILDEDCAEEIKMKCEIVEAKLAKIRNLKNKETGTSFKCPVCNRPTSGDNAYCPSCGSNMSVDAEVDIEK